jgi:hypothetical protein
MAASYDIVMRDRRGRERTRRYASEDELKRGSVVLIGGRYWLVERVEEPRVFARLGRYRLTLRHPDGHEETGSFRRLGPAAPRIGHQLTTVEDDALTSWQVVDERLALDAHDEPFLELIAERDYAEAESPPDHQLEHALERNAEDASAGAALTAAKTAGVAIELVALDAGQAPDWDEAERFLDALILDEVEDDLIEMCGVDPDRDPQDTWLDTVKERLRDDLRSFRTDVEGDHDQIEEWDFRGGRIFAAVGRVDEESDPLSGYGWMCRLVDAEALGAAGFQRVRKALLAPD